jgi:hypothetical protein
MTWRRDKTEAARMIHYEVSATHAVRRLWPKTRDDNAARLQGPARPGRRGATIGRVAELSRDLSLR